MTPYNTKLFLYQPTSSPPSPTQPKTPTQIKLRQRYALVATLLVDRQTTIARRSNVFGENIPYTFQLPSMLQFRGLQFDYYHSRFPQGPAPGHPVGSPSLYIIKGSPHRRPNVIWKHRPTAHTISYMMVQHRHLGLGPSSARSRVGVLPASSSSPVSCGLTDMWTI